MNNSPNLQREPKGFRRNLLWLFISVFLLGIQTSSKVNAQFISHYGSPTLNEFGNSLLPELDASGIETGNLWIAGTRVDSTLLMLVGPNGNILGEWTFKICLPGEVETPADFRYDDTFQSLVGCGRVPAMAGNTPVLRAYAFRFDVATSTLVWGNRFRTLGAGSAILPDPFPVTGFQPGWNMFGIFYSTTATGALDDHAANYVRLDFATGNIQLTSDHIYTNDISPDDHAAAEYDPINREYVSTGRWAYNANQATFRSNYFRSDVLGMHLSNAILYGDVDSVRRVYGVDVLLSPGGVVRPTILSSGDFNGSTANAWTFALSQHNPANGAITWSSEFNLTNYQGETAQEVILTPNGDYLVYGNTFGPQRRPFLAEITSAGAVNWAMSYNGGGDEFCSGTTQSQVVFLNNSYYFVANQTIVGNTDILLVRTALDGTIQGCTTLVEQVTPNARQNDFVMKLDSLGPNSDLVGFPPVNDPNLPAEVLCGGCWADGHADYLQITSNTTISGLVVWPAKVYVASGVVVTVSGGTLDVTNSDVVFGTCAEIRIGGNGNIRLNNSVLRPCLETETWTGLIFENQGHGVLNTTTIKNALTGVDVVGSLAANNDFDVRITDNHFINCRRGIRVNNATMLEAITGNRFTIDERGIDYNPSCEMVPIYNFQHFGILGSLANFRGLVSQNDFVNSSERGSALTFLGIGWVSSSGVISSNYFSNMFYATSLTGCTNATVENNTMELTMSLRTPSEAQIQVVGNSVTVWVTGNHLTNVVESYPSAATPTTTAIYVERSRVVNVKENDVDGFVSGVFITGSSNSNVSENSIKNADLVGIVVNDGFSLSIGCNEIWMRARPNVNTIGIAYGRSVLSGTAATQPSFIGNCVFNSSIAMQTNRTATTYGLPQITNNYFYNYTTAGVNNINFTGSIGTGLLYAQSGHNTFVSNNVPNLVLDVASNVAINVFGCYGVNNPGMLVGVAGNNLFNSNTACGHQMGNIGMHYLPMDYCDQFFQDNIAASNLRIQQGDYGVINELPEGSDARMEIGLAAMLRMIQENPAQANDLFAFLVSPGTLTAEQASQVRFAYLMATDDIVAAEGMLADMGQFSPSLQAYADIYRVVLQAMMDGRSPVGFNPAEIAALQAMDDARGPFAELAREFLQVYDHNHNYIMGKLPTAVLPDMEVRQVSLPIEQLLLSPNPTADHVRITYVLENPDGYTLTATDMLGRVLFSAPASANHDFIDVDLRTWAKGIYNFNLSNGQGHRLNQKLIRE